MPTDLQNSFEMLEETSMFTLFSKSVYHRLMFKLGETLEASLVSSRSSLTTSDSTAFSSNTSKEDFESYVRDNRMKGPCCQQDCLHVIPDTLFISIIKACKRETEHDRHVAAKFALDLCDTTKKVHKDGTVETCYNYSIKNQPVCRGFFCTIFKIHPSTLAMLKNCDKVVDNRSISKVSNSNGETEGGDSARAYIKKLYEIEGNPDPVKENLKWLGSFTTIHREYQHYKEYCTENALLWSSNDRFYKIWKEFSLLKIKDPKSDVCDDCTQMEAQMRSARGNALAQEEIKIKIDAHQKNVKLLNCYYHKSVKESKIHNALNNTDRIIHFSLDFAQDIKGIQFQNQPKQYFFQPVPKINIFALVDEVTKYVQYYVYDERIGSKSANEIITVLQWRLSEYDITNHSILKLQLDNCAGQNKNFFFFSYLWTLIKVGNFKTIYLSFMRQGHTKFIVDAMFGILKTILDGIDIFWIEHLIEIVSRNKRNIKRLEVVNDWKGQLTKLGFKALSGISKFHLFKIDTEGIYGKDDPTQEWPIVPNWKISLTVSNDYLKSVSSIPMTPFKDQKINALKYCLKSISEDKKVTIQKLIDDNEILTQKLQTNNFDSAIVNVDNVITNTQNNVEFETVPIDQVHTNHLQNPQTLSTVIHVEELIVPVENEETKEKTTKQKRKRVKSKVGSKLELTPIKSTKRVKSMSSREVRNIVDEIQDNAKYEVCLMADRGCTKQHGVCGYCQKKFHLDMMFPSESGDNPTKIACKLCQFCER